MAAYEGAVASLLEALASIGEAAGGMDDDAPIILIGGGARGRTWRDVVRRLSGRPVLIPNAEELVALGAAVQATAIWRGEPPAAVARRWHTDAGTLLDPLPRDDERLARIRAIRDVVVRGARRPRRASAARRPRGADAPDRNGGRPLDRLEHEEPGREVAASRRVFLGRPEVQARRSSARRRRAGPVFAPSIPVERGRPDGDAIRERRVEAAEPQPIAVRFGMVEHLVVADDRAASVR